MKIKEATSGPQGEDCLSRESLELEVVAMTNGSFVALIETEGEKGERGRKEERKEGRLYMRET